MWITQKILKLLLGKEKTIPQMTKESQLGLLSQLYQNDSFRRYLDAREEYLIKQAVEQFIGGKLRKADGLSGQLLEVRSLRIRTKAAYLAMNKLINEEKSRKESGKELLDI